MPHKLSECRSVENSFCSKPHHSLIHFPREDSSYPSSQLKFDAPVFIPKQSKETPEAVSQSQLVATNLVKETARRLQSELQDGLQSCGMVLHKWSFNSPYLLNSSSLSDVEHSFSAESDLSVKTLGIGWKPLQDCFVFKVSILSKSSFTKREVLSVIARLYDPLGFLGPVLTRAKVLIQRLWQQKLDWDDVLPDQIAKEWKEFVTTFKCIETV
ncbi:uncharacterized protein TNCT_97221 [Trichonephila clavata]|uniref:Uncharacterized protein n=1 Tax=Trichonephila clavata TaxID=2740835 RepID=A0A8X6KXR0_TRICU|nr:uncharacterized protein TNCT_97221 [Trichonephila clavata]